jgi:hypothetical protein
MTTPIYDELVRELRARTPENVLARVQLDQKVLDWQEQWRAEREG